MEALYRLLVFSLVVLIATTPALGWAPGTHAYVVTHMKGVAGANQANLIYGAVVPDINQMLSNQQDSIYFFSTHYKSLDLWTAQNGSIAQHELAFGYVTHNEKFGLDRFSHIQSHVYPDYLNPFPEYEFQNGYVWQKSGELCAMLKQQFAGYPVVMELVSGHKGLMNCHFIVEYGMDILLKWTKDPQLGQKLIDAVDQHDSGQMIQLLMTGYPEIANDFITGKPELGGYSPYLAWAGTVRNYGLALSQPMGLAPGQDVDSVANFLVTLASQLLKAELEAYGVPAEALKPLIYYGLLDSIALTQPDFSTELHTSMSELHGKLASHKTKL